MSFIKSRDMSFILNDWLKIADLCERPQFAEHDRETFDAIMELSEQIAMDAFATHFKDADENEPHLVDGKVKTLPAIKDAMDVYAESGFFATGFAEEHGGMQLPATVAAASFAHFCAANIATAAYPMLTGANARLIAAYGTEKQIETWAMPEIEGRYFGTMCLSEPQAGSSLADIRTRATPEGASDELGERYRIKGNKMWISGGDQEMSENIVHLVLAKIPNEDGTLPAGVQGISLFIVPKFLPDGSRNDVICAGLNHKMGYRGTVNTLMNFGENEGALGWRIGEPGQGLACMFHMMNEARIMVGLGAAALAYRGYTQSLEYARERPQGRVAPKGGRKDPTAPQNAIIEHADVKRMLMAQKSYSEGALGLVLYSSKLLDDSNTHPDEAERIRAHKLLDLLTPITKSWPSEFGLIANDHAIQIHGGYGYTREYDVEQIYRDNRLNPIHEGTHGIQGQDLVGRKLISDKGEALGLLQTAMAETIQKARELPDLANCASNLLAAWNDVAKTVQQLMDSPDRGRAMDDAGVFLSGFGHMVVAWILLDQAIAAHELDATEAEYKAGKLASCSYFFGYELPKIAAQMAIVRNQAMTCGDIDPAWF